MESILKLAKSYAKSTHGNLLPKVDSKLPETLTYLYDPGWDTNGLKAPYEILTYLLDCYYCLPERPDLASLFGWQAINHSYNEFILQEPKYERLRDSTGLHLLNKNILKQYAKYKPLLNPYIDNMPDKIYRYVASYLLKGYINDKRGFPDKYSASSYNTMISKISILKEILDKSYGKALYDISSPTLIDDKLYINADKKRSTDITRSFAEKLKDLVQNHTANITLKDTSDTKTYRFKDSDVLVFLIYGVLYASRCNNFHGNSASRLNSVNADKETFIMYTNVFLLEYMILAITLNIQGKLSDTVLNMMKENSKLMI